MYVRIALPVLTLGPIKRILSGVKVSSIGVDLLIKLLLDFLTKLSKM